jgi:hypothetical protein
MGSGCTSAHEEVFTPVLTMGVRTRPSKNAASTRTAYDVLYNLPVRLVSREKPWMWPTRARHDRRPYVDGQPRSAPAAGGSARGGTRAAQAGEPDTRQLTAPQTANTLLPRMLEEEADR